MLIRQNGFTLVEISIVMIIIGLLIGGTFGGMKLIENMQVNKTVQDLKAIESAALTFKDTYGRLPGDMPNTAARLSNCTVAPCATGGNGDRRLEGGTTYNVAIAATSERYTFWHHLQASNILSMNYSNTTNMEFDEGQPSSPIGGGYRITNLQAATPCGTAINAGIITVSVDSSAAYATSANTLKCNNIASIDDKMDDGNPYSGILHLYNSTGCVITPSVCGTDYNRALNSSMYAFWYDAKF